MIVNVPSGDDFRRQGARFLNAAWENATPHLVEWEDEPDQDLPDEYWAAFERDLPLWLSLAQNGVDHLVKACIADVSPFLLIVGAPEKWPAPKHGNIRFSDFRTVDAQDLLRVLGCVSAVKVSKSFEQAYEARRRDRNEQYHTVPEEVLREAKTLIEYVLQATHELVGPGSWIRMRRESIRRSPGFQVSPEGVASSINGDLRSMVKVLGRGQLLEFLGIDKKKRLYSCPVCLRDCSEGEHDYGHIQKGVAQLTSTQPGESELFCVACGSVTEVQRIRCDSDGCKADVLHYGTCLTCHAVNDDGHDYTWNLNSLVGFMWSVERNFDGREGWYVVSWYGARKRENFIHEYPMESEADALKERDIRARAEAASPQGRRLEQFRRELDDSRALVQDCEELASKLGCGVDIHPIRVDGRVRAATFDREAPRVETARYGEAPRFVRLFEVDRNSVRDALLALQSRLQFVLCAK